MATIKSIEQKAKRYDEALEMAKKLIENEETNVPVFYVNNIKDIFPELEESEDERIRKNLISHFKETIDNIRSEEIIPHDAKILVGKMQKWIAWLEKQGEHAKFREAIQVGDQVTKNEYGVLVNLSQLKRVAKPADKVESKFKVGDWVVYTGYLLKDSGKEIYVIQIKSVEDGRYNFTDTSTLCFDSEKDMRLWTVQDAKAGDILHTSSTASNETFIFKGIDEKGNMECFCSYDSEDKYCDGKYHFIGKPTFKTKPATKEQRNLLFQKIKEAGYEWDTEKLELKKIWQNPAWSEEDERLCQCLIQDQEEALDKVSNDKYGHSEIISDLEEMYRERIAFLKSLKDRVQPQSKQEWSEGDETNASCICAALDCYYRLHEDRNNTNGQEDLDKARNWLYNRLKSLRPQNHWKPSDEQMDALLKLEEMHVLEHENNQENAHLYMVVKSIREQLLKLREE